MKLRERIQEAIERHRDNPHDAGVAVCVVLENELDLAGNGWFDNDELVLKAIGWDEG